LGRLALLEPDTVLERLRKLASDPRWRVREGVAIALQRIGRADMRMLLTEMRDWARGDKWLRSRDPDVAWVMKSNSPGPAWPDCVRT
jgi:hypothetical protein